MRKFAYLDFDVLVDRGPGEGHYRARVVTAPSGPTGAVDFTLPFSDVELENFLLKVGQPRRPAARGLGARSTAIQDFGSSLFEALFHDDLRMTLATSLAQVESKEAGLRLRLRLADVPELADLPWEFMWDPDQRSFLALSEWTPLVRYLDLPGAVRPLQVSPPLRLLVVIASPSDLVPLDVKAERARMGEALAELEQRKLVIVDTAPDGTLASLQRKLRREDYHVFHFIGHGGYDAEAEDGVLAFEDKLGRAQEVQAGHLGMLLHDHRTLRMAVLNSCEGARGGRQDPYAGTAQTLVRRGIPAVVAMQFEITDQAAITFSQTLYESIADGFPVDAAIAQARLAIRGEDNLVEWATPVLYLRAPDGRIFDVEAVVPPPPEAPAAEPPPPLESDQEYVEALARIEAGRWAPAVELLSHVSTRHPDEVSVHDQMRHARRQMQLELLDMRAQAAAEDHRWADATFALERISEIDPSYGDVAARLDDARHQLAGPSTTVIPRVAERTPATLPTPRPHDEGAPPPSPAPAPGGARPPVQEQPPRPDQRRLVVVAAAVLAAALLGLSTVLWLIRDDGAEKALSDDLIIIARETPSGRMQIVAIPSRPGVSKQVLDTRASAVFPSLTRDRTTLAYVDQASRRIRVVSVDGDGDRLLFPGGDPSCRTGRRLSWGPGDREVAQRCVDGPKGLYLRSVDDGSTRRLVPGDTRGPTFSRDGDYVAYWVGPEDKGGDLYVVSTETSRVTPLDSGGAADPAWSPDGNRLAYTAARGSSRVLYAADFVTSPEPRLPTFELLATGDVWQPTWSPGGDRIAYRSGDKLCVQAAVSGVRARCFAGGDPDVSPLWSSQ